MFNALMPETCVQSTSFLDKSSAPRIFKTSRSRIRKTENISKEESGSWVGADKMEEKSWTGPQIWDSDRLFDRDTLCLPHFQQNTVVHAGNDGYMDVLHRYFQAGESNATERLVKLKHRLQGASTHDFWQILMEETCEITGSQCGLVAKRILVDDHDSAIEMPELGEPGSCLMGIAFYINHNEIKELYRDYRCHAFGTPCAHMRHDKVLIVPERMPEFIRNNPNNLPWKNSEAFIGVPLFADGKCFAHFALIWSQEGASKRKLSWTFLEMIMHSLEDMIVQRIVEGRSFVKEVNQEHLEKIIPLSATTASQSLKPYARSLSHELRTPMQGVVGMLDIMYSTVLDAIATSKNELIRSVFDDLKSNIEVVQDSSKRAVEAADNVVHAYDLNMQMPETPITAKSITLFPGVEAALSAEYSTAKHSRHQRQLSSPTGNKRAREEEPGYHPGPPLKHSALSFFELSRVFLKERSAIPKDMPELPVQSLTTPAENNQSLITAPSVSVRRRVNIRLFGQNLVYDTIRGCHPIREVHTSTPLGEIHEIESCGSRGEVQARTIHLCVGQEIPEIIVMDEQYLQFSLQKLVDNAMKFTECGTINITVKMGGDSQFLEIWVMDTGCGIKPDSKEHVFEPHFQQDSSISRARDGLGLSLFNAKAQIRKRFAGDITLERSDTEGPAKGSEFLIRLPVSIVEADGVETYSVGPTTPHQRSRRPSPHPLSNLSPACSDLVSTESTTLSAISVVLRGPMKPIRKRAGFNPNLAEDYPLNFLIAEDNTINRQIVITSLKKLGYREENITVAFDGVEAVNEYEASLSRQKQPRYNAILMDIWMPNLDGYEATRKILKMAEAMGESTTVMAITADITEQCVERAKAAGMQGFLPKPYKLLDMERLIVENFPRSSNGES